MQRLFKYSAITLHTLYRVFRGLPNSPNMFSCNLISHLNDITQPVSYVVLQIDASPVSPTEGRDLISSISYWWSVNMDTASMNSQLHNNAFEELSKCG